MTHTHSREPKWIAGVTKCRWCHAVTVNVFPEDLTDIECSKCGNRTGITYARVRRMRRSQFSR